MNESIRQFDLRIFRAIEEPERVADFLAGHRKVLSNLNAEALKVTQDTWSDNPSVYVMALYSGQRMVGGSRLHLFHPEKSYPFEDAMRSSDADMLRALEKNEHLLQAEWCGLWVSLEFKGYGFSDVLKRCALATARNMGLELIYGICPPHTMDLFRTVGYRFVTWNDEVIRFNYPSDNYRSYIIQCEVDTLEFTFRNERKQIEEWQALGDKPFVYKSRMEEYLIKFHGYPSIPEETLIRPRPEGAPITRSLMLKRS